VLKIVGAPFLFIPGTLGSPDGRPEDVRTVKDGRFATIVRLMQPGLYAV